MADDHPPVIAGKPPCIEQMQWHDATLSLPDHSKSVLCWMRPYDGFILGMDVLFECGYWDAIKGRWLSCVTADQLPGVTHWAEPQGPLIGSALPAAQPMTDEPIAWLQTDSIGERFLCFTRPAGADVVPLYAAPVAQTESPAVMAALQQALTVLEAERDAIRSRLDRAIAAAEEHFGDDAIRYKISLYKTCRAKNIFPQAMDGRWYAFQRADNDAHIGLSMRLVGAEEERDKLRAEFDAAIGKVERVRCALNAEQVAALTIMLDHFGGDPRTECLRQLVYVPNEAFGKATGGAA